ADRGDTAAALGAALAARVIDENATHELRSEPDELRAALPADVTLADQTHVRLVHERGALERVVGALAAQLPLREPAQLAVNQWHELGERALVPRGPGDQQFGHALVTRFVHVLVTRPGFLGPPF